GDRTVDRPVCRDARLGRPRCPTPHRSGGASRRGRPRPRWHSGRSGRPCRRGMGTLAFLRHDPPLEARMTSYMSTVDTQFGPFTIVVDEDGSVLASGWTNDLDLLLPQVHPSL